jgi:hypothetical protein
VWDSSDLRSKTKSTDIAAMMQQKPQQQQQGVGLLRPRPQSAQAGVMMRRVEGGKQPGAFSPQYGKGQAAAAGSSSSVLGVAGVPGGGTADAASLLPSRPSPDYLADRHQPPPGCFGASTAPPPPSRARHLARIAARAASQHEFLRQRWARHLNAYGERRAAAAHRCRPEGGVRRHAGARAAAHPDRPDKQLPAVPHDHRGLDVRGRRGVQAEPVRSAALRALLRPGAAAREGQEVAAPAGGNVLHSACRCVAQR